MPSPLPRSSNRSIARKRFAISGMIRRFPRQKASNALWNGCKRCTMLTSEKSSSSRLEGRAVLVTGGAGAIGTNLVARLGDFRGERTIILDNLSSAFEWNIPQGPRIRFVRGDILDDETLKAVFEERPEVVYHLAAHFANQNSVDHPEIDLMVNGMGILKVLEHARKTDVECLVYASSGCGIYGSDTPMPFTEDYVSMDLQTPYQVTKMLGELYTNMYHNLYGLPIVNARFFNSYGPGEVPGKYRNVIPNFFYWAMNGQP